MTETRPVFYFIDVDAHLPNEWSAEKRRDYAERGDLESLGIRRRGILSHVFLDENYKAEETRIRNGILQQCILSTQLFQTDTAESLRIPEKQKVLYCPERPKLLFELADALLAYDPSSRLERWGFEKIQDELETALTSMEKLARILQTLCREKTAKVKPNIQRDGKTIRLNVKMVNRWFQDTVEMVSALTPDVGMQWGNLPGERGKTFSNDLLITSMWNAFIRYGPTDIGMHDRRLAIAAIVMPLLSPRGASHFGLRQGDTLDKVAKRLGKRHQRIRTTEK